MSAVLVFVDGQRHSDGRWYERWYCSHDNPIVNTPFLHEARRFDSLVLARATKKALYLPRRFAARTLPGWLG